jgi:hypothetical protein
MLNRRLSQKITYRMIPLIGNVQHWQFIKKQLDHCLPKDGDRTRGGWRIPADEP